MKTQPAIVLCSLFFITSGIAQQEFSPNLDHGILSRQEAEFTLTKVTERNLLDDSTLITLQSLLSWSENEENYSIQAETHYLLGKRHLLLMQEAGALVHFKRAGELFSEIGNPAKQGFALERMGLVYLQKNQLDSAFLSFQKSVAIYTHHKLKEHLWNPLLGMSNVYRKHGNREQALKYARQAIDVVKGTSNRTSKVLALRNIVQLAHEYDSLQLYTRYSDEYLQLYTPLEIDQDIVQHIGHFSEVKNPEERIEIIRISIKKLSSLPVTLELISSYYQLGNAFAEIGDWHNAIASWHTGLETERNKLSTVHFSPVLARAISDAYKLLGDYQKSLEYYVGYATMRDSLIQNQMNSQIAELQVQYETQAKDSEIISQREALTRRTWQRNGILIILLVIFSSGAYVIHIQRRHLLDQKTIAQQREALHQNELNELRNEHALSTLQTLISAQEEERRRIAQDLHDSLGASLATFRMQLQREIQITDAQVDPCTESAFTMLDNIISEVRRISHNMMPQALIRMGLPTALEDLAATIQLSGKLQVSFQNIDYEEPLSQNKEITLYRIAQELCTNALRHSDAQNLLIQLSRHNGSATLVVEDDGKGIAGNAENGNGIGLHNVRSRVSYLGGDLEIISHPGEGTSVTLQIPVI